MQSLALIQLWADITLFDMDDFPGLHALHRDLKLHHSAEIATLQPNYDHLMTIKLNLPAFSEFLHLKHCPTPEEDWLLLIKPGEEYRALAAASLLDHYIPLPKDENQSIVVFLYRYLLNFRSRLLRKMRGDDSLGELHGKITASLKLAKAALDERGIKTTVTRPNIREQEDK